MRKLRVDLDVHDIPRAKETQLALERPLVSSLPVAIGCIPTRTVFLARLFPLLPGIFSMDKFKFYQRKRSLDDPSNIGVDENPLNGFGPSFWGSDEPSGRKNS